MFLLGLLSSGWLKQFLVSNCVCISRKRIRFTLHLYNFSFKTCVILSFINNMRINLKDLIRDMSISVNLLRSRSFHFLIAFICRKLGNINGIGTVKTFFVRTSHSNYQKVKRK